MTRKLVALAHLTRLNMAALTVSVPLLGAWANHPTLPALIGMGLAFVGLCAHIFGFALNDLIDRPLDRAIPARRRHPFVTGQLSLLAAWVLVLASVPVALAVYYLLLRGSQAGLTALVFSVVLSVVYNRWSKWGGIPRILPELALALSIGLLCLSGTLVVGLSADVRSYLFALTLALILLLLNSVPSGLKDLKYDAEFGARSFVIALGGRIEGEDRILIPIGLRIYSLIWQTFITLAIVALIFLYAVSWWLALAAILFALYAGLHLRMLLNLTSFSALRQSMPLLSGYFNYVALSLILFSRFPLWLQAMLAAFILLLVSIPIRLSLRLWRARAYLADED